jgi:hypothetical protein
MHLSVSRTESALLDDHPPAIADLSLIGVSLPLSIPEMAGGWGGAIQRDEISFLVLDGG